MPEQYYWVHKRFKTRPPGEPSLYWPRRATASVPSCARRPRQAPLRDAAPFPARCRHGRAGRPCPLHVSFAAEISTTNDDARHRSRPFASCWPPCSSWNSGPS